MKVDCEKSKSCNIVCCSGADDCKNIKCEDAEDCNVTFKKCNLPKGIPYLRDDAN